MVKLNIDFRLLETRTELSGLPQALDLLESQIQFLVDQQRVRADADLKALAEKGAEWDDAEIHRVLQERDYAVEHVYPRLFRGPFLVMLWATYEAGLKECARFVQRNRAVELDIDEVKGSDVRKTARRYFRAVLNVDFARDTSRAGELGRLYKVRNAFAHANGRLVSLSDNVRRTVDSMVEEGHLDESMGYIVPTKSYLLAACTVVQEELTALVKEVLAWHDSIKGSDQPSATGPN